MTSFINITNELIIRFLETVPDILALDSIKGVVSMLVVGILAGILMEFFQH